MPQEFDNTNRGALFNNRDQKEKEGDRDYGGKINATCPHCGGKSDYWLSGWIKESKKGLIFLSLAVKAVESQGSERGRKGKGNVVDINDEIPF